MESYLEFSDISKEYPGVKALDHVSLSFAKGEVHALMGANGAGKSTLIKILSGAEQPTSGEIRFEGNAYPALKPDLALKLGIGVVYQENNLVPTLSVMENVFLGHWSGGCLTVNKKEMREKTLQYLQEFHVDVDPDVEVERLSPAMQQIIEIIRIISRPLKVLVLDEPTAPLTVAEVEVLFHIVKTLKERNITIIYISHRMEEIFQLSDRVSVLRDGCYVGTELTSEIDRSQLISMMIGKEVSSDCPPRTTPVEDEVVLEAEHITGNGVEDISFQLHKGEILGFAGLVGCGRTELMHVIFGDVPMERGTLKIGGNPVKLKTCHQAIRAGMGLVPEDRKAAGLLLDKSVKVNISLSSLPRLSRLTVIKRKAEQETVKRFSDALQIKTPSFEQLAEKLSGGNQQKVVVARWLATNSDILIFDEPTRGIDVAAKQEIYKLMRQLTGEGKSILMVSSDMEELLGMADRLVVLTEGQKAGEVEKADFDAHKILDMASGQR